MSSALVAVVGRPNVGKSTLFNRLIGARKAIVEDNPGVTRDRLYGVADWDGSSFMVVDTGGIDPSGESGLPGHIRAQAQIAMDEADLILFVVDAIDGATAIDVEIAMMLRRSGRPVLLVVNKTDGPKREIHSHAFYELGLGEVYPVSAAHGRRFGELCDAIVEHLPDELDLDTELAMPKGTRIAFMGRPNAGKSTLINALMREPRVIVDATAGTTRDSIDLPFEFNGKPLVLIDTAGLRRRRQVARAQEKLAAIKSIRAMERTQVVVLVVDASVGVTDQDQRLARMAFERGKGVVVALHKWDLVAGDARNGRACLASTEEALAFLERPRIIKTSAVGPGRDEGKGRSRNLDQVLIACLKTARGLGRHIPTSDLNQELAAAIADNSPPMHKSRPVKLLYATQAETAPPLIVISANKGRCLATAYERYLVRRFRRRWDLRGVPIRIVVRGRGRGNSERARPGPTAKR